MENREAPSGADPGFFLKEEGGQAPLRNYHFNYHFTVFNIKSPASSLRHVKAWVERIKRPPTENAKILFNDTE